MIYMLTRTLSLVFYVLEMAVFIFCILSWVAPQSRVFGILQDLIEPFVRPFRPLGRWLMEKTGLPVDFSFMFLILAIYAAERIVLTILRALA